MRLTIFLLGAVAIGLCGCSVAGEKVRLTFDARVLQPGTPRADVESELGRSDSTTVVGDHVVAQYATDRVDASGKAQLVGSREGVDLFTLGLGEAIDPLAISENESKLLIVTYDHNRIFGDVKVVCRSDGREAKYHSGFTCSKTVHD